MKRKLKLLSPIKSLIKVMRLSILICFITAIHISAMTYSQASRLSLKLKNTDIRQAFREIEQSSGLSFLYYEKAMDSEKKVSINVKNKSLPEVLNDLLKGTKLTYEIINDKFIVVSSKMSIQRLKVSGTVTDEATGEALPGVSIHIEGLQTGTVTDLNGKFSIEVPDVNSVLIFSIVGYRTERVVVSGRTTIDVKLSSEEKKLEEVVVVGYGTQKKVNLTGAVSSLNGENISQKPVTQLSAALQGLAPGVTITQSTGQPGVDAGTIRIRGVGTLNNNDPLILVDGVEYDINNVDANDVENISILKDAAASSIYGVRAANGVVLITTKRGSKEKTRVTYSGYTGFQDPTKLPNFVGAQEFMKLVNLTRTNSGSGALYSDADIAAYNDPNRDKYKYPDVFWMDEILKGNGHQQEHSLSIAGGSEKSQYRFSTNYFQQNGLIKRTNFDRLTVRFNSDIEVNKYLNVSADVSGKFSNRTEPQKGMWFQFGQAIVSNPTIPVKYANGDWSVDRGDGNPVRLQYEGGGNKIEDNVLTGNFKVNLKIIDGLRLSGIVNGNYTTDFTSSYTQALSYNLPSGGTVTKDNNSITKEADKNWMINYQGLLNYNKTIDVHNFSILLGISKITNRTNYLTGYRNNGSLSDLPQLNAGDPSSQTNNGYLDEYDLLSYFGRLNYSYNEKYLLEANIRRDASSRFSKDNRWGTFPSFSAGWRISKEAFMKDILLISELKLRGSWGKLGNQEVGSNYAYQSLINLGYNYPFGGTLTSGARMTTYPNTDISWETTQMTDFGLDAGILKGQLDFSFDYYVKKTTNILLDLPIPESVGLNAPVQNAGAVQNKGWEFSIGYRGQIAKDFKYDVRFNMADVHNKITDMKGADYLAANNDNIIWAYYEGHPIGSYYGYDSEGILRTDAQVSGHVTQFGSAVVKGDLGYKDLSKDGNVNSKDRTFLGSDIPRYTYGLNLNASYKGIDFSAFFQGVGKVDINTLQFNKAPTNPDGNFRDFQTDNWRTDNVNASFPRLITSTQNYVSSSYWMKSGAYLRLKNIQLGYTIPALLTQKVGISRFRIYIAGQNVVTWSPLNKYGIDPENPVDNRYYPQVKTYTAGVNVEF